jgi:hypothetical protein
MATVNDEVTLFKGKYQNRCEDYNEKMADGVNELLLLLVLLLTTIELSLDGSNPYTSTNKTNKNKYT